MLRSKLIRLASTLPSGSPERVKILSVLKKEAMRLPSTPEVVEALNELLRRELTVVNQYMVQYALCSNWKYKTMAGFFRSLALAEMKHAELLIERIVLLEDIPEVGQLNKIKIGATVQEQLQNTWEAEREAVTLYNRAIALCHKTGDNGTRTILEPILAEEEQHLDTDQSYLDQIKDMGIENFLAEQSRE